MEPAYSLQALVVFKNTLYPEMIRTVHSYKLKDRTEKVVEREYVFYDDEPYEEMICSRVFTLYNFSISEQFEGRVNGVWLCIFVFNVDRGCPSNLNDIPIILSIARNHKLSTIPTLTKDLLMIFKLNGGTEAAGLPNAGESMLKSRCGIALDLNSVPSLEEESDSPPDMMEDKKKRANPKDVACLSIEDLSKYFDLPILEASKSLNIGLTVLKRKCREFGIPRWPHRKIKSLDGLIRDLQEEVEQQQRDDEAAAMAVAQRQRMVESEKECIEKKPFVEIQWETKKFRQDNFKRRHKAKSREVFLKAKSREVRNQANNVTVATNEWTKFLN